MKPVAVHSRGLGRCRSIRVVEVGARKVGKYSACLLAPSSNCKTGRLGDLDPSSLFIFLRCCMVSKAIFQARDGQRAMGCTGSQDAKCLQPSAERSGAVVYYHAPELPKVSVVARPPNRDSHERHVKECSLEMFLETCPGHKPS